MSGIDPVLARFTAIASFDRRRREYRKVGWIYAARNPSFLDPVYKVGQSSRPPTLRVAELSSSTSVYVDFELVYFVHVGDRDTAEGLVQIALQDYRVNPTKECSSLPRFRQLSGRWTERQVRCQFPLGGLPVPATSLSPFSRASIDAPIVGPRTAFPMYSSKSA